MAVPILKSLHSSDKSDMKNIKVNDAASASSQGSTFVPQGAAWPGAELGVKALAHEIMTWWDTQQQSDMLSIVVPAVALLTHEALGYPPVPAICALIRPLHLALPHFGFSRAAEARKRRPLPLVLAVRVHAFVNRDAHLYPLALNIGECER